MPQFSNDSALFNPATTTTTPTTTSPTVVPDVTEIVTATPQPNPEENTQSLANKEDSRISEHDILPLSGILDAFEEERKIE